MNRRQLIAKLTAERVESFIQAPMWQTALEREMSWEGAVASREAVQEAVHLLSPYASVFLKEMLRLFAAMPVEEERLLKEIRSQTSLSGAECQIGLHELQEGGILFSVSKVWGERIYFLPMDCFVMWQGAFFPCAVNHLSSSQKEKLMSGEIRSICRPLGRQLLSAFSVLALSGLELTAKGVLPKKTIAKLEQAVDWDEKALGSFKLNGSLKEHYSLKTAFILEAASALRLLHQLDNTLMWDEVQLSDWLNLEEGERERELMSWCLSILLPAGKDGAHLASALGSLQAGIWYSEREVGNWLSEAGLIKGNGFDHMGSHAWPDWYGLFHGMGWMELVDSKDEGNSELFFRWKAISPFHSQHSSESKLDEPLATIQANGEIIVEAACPFSHRWELELIAKRVSDEGAAVYCLEAASVALALEHGRTQASILSFLQQLSGELLVPDTITAMLEEWTSRSCRTSFAEVTLLRCDNEQMASYIEKDSSLAPMLLQKLGSVDYIVDKAQIPTIRSLLKQGGYPPRKSLQVSWGSEQNSYPVLNNNIIEGIGSLSQSYKCNNKSTRFIYIYEALPLQHYELNDFTASQKNTLAQLESVPAMWTKQLRAYHHSTRKELIEQALQWETPVLLRLEQGLLSFVPEKIQQRESGWAVVGMLRDERNQDMITLTPDMWDEMRIIIPGSSIPI